MIQLLQPGEITKLFDANPIGTPPVLSDVFALPSTRAKILTWTTWFSVAPAAVSLKLQISNNVAGPWSDVDASTLVAGETRSTVAMNAAFVRVQKLSQTGAGNLTVELTLAYT